MKNIAKHWTTMLLICAALALGVAANAATLFSDNFSDDLVANPTYSPTGAQWVAESGLLSAGSDTPPGFGYYSPEPGTLMFDTGGAKASINFGSTVANTPVEVRFRLRQSNGTGGSYLVYWGFKNTASGKIIEQWASPNSGYFGPKGGFLPGGLTGPYALSTSGWDYLKYIYNPSTGVVDVWLGTDGITYTKVATWTDTQGITSVDQFYFQSGGTVSWRIDDVQILGAGVETPAFSPNGGGFSAPMNVTISCATAGATIRYTTDGTEPTETNGTVIASGGTVFVDQAVTIKAKAWKNGLAPSDVGSASYTPLVFSDNFSDNLVVNPTYSPTGAQWVAESGLLSAGSDTPPGFGYYSPEPGTLMFDTGGAKANINFGSTVANTPVEVRFRLRQSNGTGGSYLVYWGFKNTASAKIIEQWASPNSGYFGPKGGFNPGGLTGPYALSTSGWDYLKYIYNPSTGVVDVWLGTDGITYTKVATWTDTQGITSVDQFYFISGGTVSWRIDDVEIFANTSGYVPRVAAPAFSQDSGAYILPMDVTVTCATSGATIRYTTDGTEPTETNGTVVANGGSAAINQPATLKAKAWKTGQPESLTTTAVYKRIVFSDNFYDKSVFGPTYASAGVDWNIASGKFSADALNPPAGFNFYSPASGALMFSNSETSRIEVDFGRSVTNTPIEARFKLRQTDASAASYLFKFGLKDNDPTSGSYGYYYEEWASPNVNFFGGPSGFTVMTAFGLNPDEWSIAGGTAGKSLYTGNDKWNYLKMSFDPANMGSDAVKVWQAIDADGTKSFDDPSLSYTLVAQWYNGMYLGQATQFYMVNPSILSWIVDDVQIVGELQTPSAAVATPTLTPGSGVYSTTQNVVVSCATSGAQIFYTTDGTMPTESTGTEIASGSSVAISSSKILTARAFKSGLAPSTAASASYAYPTLSRPASIPSGTAVVDGDLSEWSGATWAPLDQNYDANPVDISSGSYAARWDPSGQKVYVAVKVNDTAHKFTDSYTAWNARDAVEIYIHTTGADGNYQSNQEPAQQYTVGIKNSDHSQVWAVLGGVTVPTAAAFSAAGSVSGNELRYEVAMTPFEYFGGLVGKSSIVSTLAAGQVIGIDVVAAAHNGSAYTGMKSENMMTLKFMNYGNIGLHSLTMNATSADIGAAKQLAENTLVATSGVVSAVFTDYLYIENSGRTYGIRVKKTSHGRSVGQIVNVTGTVKTLDSGERYIDASSVDAPGGSGNILPLGLTNKALGGGVNGLQVGVEGGVGLNTIGLLVRTTGQVGTKGTGWFMIDDGSGVGVKVYGAVPSGTPYVTVTGASSCEKDGSNKIQRVILASGIQIP